MKTVFLRIIALFRRARFRKKLQRLGGMVLRIEKCPYCGNDYPVREDIERCPTCGADLKLHRTAIARNEKKFSMDGEDNTGIG